MLRKIKQLFCNHKFYSLIDLDLMQDGELHEVRCEKCKKKIVFSLIAYSIYENRQSKKCCGKMAYSKKDAQATLNKCQKQKRKKQPVRIYHCPLCKKWHLTSQEKR